MGQKLRDDKIGALSHSGGTIIMAAPAWLTIGGQQYTVTSNLTRAIATDITMAANTLYMIYAVNVGGVIQLRISSNVNSVGPAGFTSWKLVGAFYSNGNTLASPVFGSFVNIEGPPQTNNPVRPTIGMFRNNDGSGWGSTPTCSWSRNGRLLSMTFSSLASAAAPTGTGNFSIIMPTNLAAIALAGNGISQAYEISQENGGYIGGISFTNLNGVSDWVPAELYTTTSAEFQVLTQPTGTGSIAKTAIGANAIVQGFVNGLPLTIWSSTPLKDL